MNVWLINQYAIPPKQAGITRHYMLARELQAQGHHVTIIASSFDHLTRQETRLKPGEAFLHQIMEGVPFLWLRTPPYPGNSMARIWNMICFAWKAWTSKGVAQLERPDVVIGSSPHLFSALAARWLAWRHGAPFVLEVRDLWPQSMIDLGKVHPRHPIVKGLGLIERHLYRAAAQIVTLLPGAASHLIEKGANPDRITWIPNGVDTERLPPPTPAASNRDTFTVLYAGSHGLANGMDSLLDTAAKLGQQGWAEKVQFVFVGDGPEKPRLMQRAETEGLRNVRFEAPVPKDQIFRVLAQADAFIVTTRNTGLYRSGISFNKIFDYLAAGRPIVFGTSAANNPIQDADAGISVLAEDPEAMAQAVIRLVELPRRDGLKRAQVRRREPRHPNPCGPLRKRSAPGDRPIGLDEPPT